MLLLHALLYHFMGVVGSCKHWGALDTGCIEFIPIGIRGLCGINLALFCLGIVPMNWPFLRTGQVTVYLLMNGKTEALQ